MAGVLLVRAFLVLSALLLTPAVHDDTWKLHLVAEDDAEDEDAEEEGEGQNGKTTLAQDSALGMFAKDVDVLSPQREDDGGADPLPVCTGPFEAGDIVTFEVGGPDFEDISKHISASAADGEAEYFKHYFSYGAHFEYGKNFDYDEANTAGNIFANVGKGLADIGINAAKGIGDVVVNVAKGAGDALKIVANGLGNGLWHTGAGITALYASVRQTTTHTGDTKWTHTEIGVGVNQLASAYHPSGVEAHAVCEGSRSLLGRTKLIVSRFKGGNLDAGHYRSTAAARVRMWKPYLSNYAATVGQWYRVVFGKCLAWRNAGDSEYFGAVTDEKVKEMWGYNPTYAEQEIGFTDGVKNYFRTHNGTQRVKPKAMFCSKFVAAIWSSTIGNPTEDPHEPVHQADVNKMLPLNPGACSPWTMMQWLTGEEGRKYWDSCIADTTKWNPCEQGR